MTKARVNADNASADIQGVTAGDGITGGGSSGVVTVAVSSDVLRSTGGQVISANTSSTALEIRQTGAGNALVVEDSANPDSSPFVINANGYVGIGTETANGILNLSSTNSTQLFLDRFGTDGNGGEIFGRKARGTADSPTAVQSGDAILWLGARGYGSTAFPSTSNGVINILAAENFTDAAQGTNITFGTTPTGSTTRSERMRIAADGATTVTYTTTTGKAVRNIYMSTSDPSGGSDGDVWIKYTA